MLLLALDQISPLPEKLRPKTPFEVSGQLEADGGVSLSWGEAEGAKSYVVHYGDANDSNPENAIYMGYSEINTWTISPEDLPSHEPGDEIYFWVQAYGIKGKGETDIEKAQYLHDGPFLGSAWSDVVSVHFPKAKTPLTLTIDGEEESGEYEVEEISQADYLVLLANNAVDPDIVYSVIPEGSEE